MRFSKDSSDSSVPPISTLLRLWLQLHKDNNNGFAWSSGYRSMCIRYYIRANDHKIINKILPARQQSILAGHYHALLEGLHSSSAAASASASLGTSPALALLAAAAGALVFAVSSGASSASSSPSGASSSSSSTPFSSSPFSASPFSLPSSSSSSCSGAGAVFRFLEAGGAARRRILVSKRYVA